MNDRMVAEVVKEVLRQLQLVQVEMSARHVHLCQEDVDKLFGTGYQLTPKRPLSQPGQYLCEERVTVLGPKGSLERVAILGPARKCTQVELAYTDTFGLGVKAPVRESGMIEGSPGITLVGPCGKVDTPTGVIVAARHIHMTVEDAKVLGCHDREKVAVEVLTDRPVVFRDVVVRIDPSFRLRMHIDMDEANRAGVRGFTLGKILK